MVNKPTNYTPYHVHSMLSNGVTNIDSITDFHEYIDKAQQLGIKAFGFSEHGSLFAWVKKKEYIEKCGMKYIHAVEVYLTEDISGEKIRDNYHCVLIAKNYDGVKELNKMVSVSFNRQDGHFYYMPRVTFDELISTSDNIIITTACLGGVLYNGTPTAKEKFLGFLKRNKHRCFLEIQHHNCQEQIEYNQLLASLSSSLDIPLIAGTDTHAINEEHMQGRAILQKAKNVNFANEDEWDLTFKTIDDLIAAYKKQNSLDMNLVYEAIENTNRMASMIEEFILDYSPKYPKLYENSEEVFKQKINEGFIERGIRNYPNAQEYIDRIHYEYDVYKHNGAIDFMLLEENYKTAMRNIGVRYGYSRGSVSGSIIAYLLHITEIDSVKFNLNFERFMNTERVSLADIDTDWYSEDRKYVKDYLYGKQGLYCCDIVTFNTIALKGAIKDVCRGLVKDNIDKLPDDVLQEVKEWDKQQRERTKNNGFGYVIEAEPYPAELQRKIMKHSVHKKIPLDHLTFANEIIDLAEVDEEKARKLYPEVFYYVDMVNGVVVSVGNHPAGCVVSPFPVDEWFGTFTTSTDEYPISLLNMKEIDSLNFVKLDILGLDNIGLIYKTCDAANIPFATPDNIPLDDIKVWESIREDTTMIFQWESQSATAYLRQLMSNKTITKIKAKNPDASFMDLLSMGNGAIRPAGESYRDKLSQGEYATYGNEALDDYLKPTLGWLVYQEQVIGFLHQFCGYTMGEADVVRRGFAKKTGTEQFIPKIKKGFIDTMTNEYGVPQEESEKIIVNFIQVIEDASSYLFSKNHSDPYSIIGYICGYLRYYYPLEFITSALNIFESKEDKSIAIIEYAKRNGIRIVPISFRHSIAQYSFNKETNEIYKGIASIKYMNSVIANEIYALKDNHYNDFIDVLVDLDNKTTANKKQIRILTELNFFSEFGDANYLLKLLDYYFELSSKKQIKRTKAERLGLNEDWLSECSGRITDKTFLDVDSDKLLHTIAQNLKVPHRKISAVIKSQMEHLGYIDIADDRYKRVLAILSIDTKYSPRLKCHSLRNGTVIECKIDKRTFNLHKLNKYDVIRVVSQKKQPKSKWNEAIGAYESVPGTSEIWLTKYEKVDL